MRDLDVSVTNIPRQKKFLFGVQGTLLQCILKNVQANNLVQGPDPDSMPRLPRTFEFNQDSDIIHATFAVSGAVLVGTLSFGWPSAGNTAKAIIFYHAFHFFPRDNTEFQSRL